MSFMVEFYYAEDASDPNWVWIGRSRTIVSSNQDIMMTYTIPSGAENQAIRVQLMYTGDEGRIPNPCHSGWYRERDDLVFKVFTPTTPQIGPILAHYNDNFGAPHCDFFMSSCDTGPYLVNGAGSVPKLSSWWKYIEEHGSNT